MTQKNLYNKKVNNVFNNIVYCQNSFFLKSTTTYKLQNVLGLASTVNNWLAGINVCQQKLKGKNNEQTKPWEVKLRENSLTSFIKMFGRHRVHLASL